MDLSFLNDYWTNTNIRANKHFNSLNNFLKEEINSSAIPEDPVKTRYKGYKKWDIHFPDKKVVIEYKTCSLTPFDYNYKTPHTSGKARQSFSSNMNSRIEEALGCAIDLKNHDKGYKLGYLLVFTLNRENNIIVPVTTIERIINKFDTMIKDRVYDFFCPLITFGVDDHNELSKNYKFEKFIDGIKSVKNTENNSLEKFFI